MQVVVSESVVSMWRDVQYRSVADSTLYAQVSRVAELLAYAAAAEAQGDWCSLAIARRKRAAAAALALSLPGCVVGHKYLVAPPQNTILG